MGPVTSDDAVIRAIAVELGSAAKREIPDVVDLLGIRRDLEDLLTVAIDRALASEGVNRAWFEAIDMARAGVVAGLDSVREEGSDSPTLWFRARPVRRTRARQAHQLADPSLHRYLDQIEFKTDLAIPLGRAENNQAATAAEALGIAKDWRLMYVGATLLALMGLAVGSRRGRWAALLIAGGVGVATVLAGLRGIEFIPIPSGRTISGAIQSRIVGGTAQSLTTWLETTLTWGYVVLAIGLVGISVAAASRRRTNRAAAGV